MNVLLIKLYSLLIFMSSFFTTKYVIPLFSKCFEFLHQGGMIQIKSEVKDLFVRTISIYPYMSCSLFS